jgi:hypothetical protein
VWLLPQAHSGAVEAFELEWRAEMAKNERRMLRKPATKFPNLQKKLQKGKIQAKQAKKK